MRLRSWRPTHPRARRYRLRRTTEWARISSARSAETDLQMLHARRRVRQLRAERLALARLQGRGARRKAPLIERAHIVVDEHHAERRNRQLALRDIDELAGDDEHELPVLLTHMIVLVDDIDAACIHFQAQR